MSTPKINTSNEDGKKSVRTVWKIMIGSKARSKIKIHFLSQGGNR